MRISTADTPKISECSHRQTPEKIPTLCYANANQPPPYPAPYIFLRNADQHADNWDEIVLKNADERIEKTRNDTARLVKSDLNFHLFFLTLLSLLLLQKKLEAKLPCFLSKDIIHCIHLHHHVLQRKTRGKAVPSTAQPKKPESSPKSNLQKYEYPPNTKWRHEEDSARLLCAIKKNQKLKIISPKCRVPHLIGPFSQFRPDFLF